MASLFLAICIVESGCNPAAIGDNGSAVGIAQIRPICVEDCNRIATLRGLSYRFSLDDRRDLLASWRMFVIYTGHYTGQNGTAEQRARVWNGGPRGNDKRATLPYWRKVRKQLGKTKR